MRPAAMRIADTIVVGGLISLLLSSSSSLSSRQILFCSALSNAAGRAAVGTQRRPSFASSIKFPPSARSTSSSSSFSHRLHLVFPDKKSSNRSISSSRVVLFQSLTSRWQRRTTMPTAVAVEGEEGKRQWMKGARHNILGRRTAKRGDDEGDRGDDDRDKDDGGGGENVNRDPVVRETSFSLRRASWFSWWSQVILTTVSSVILFFANNVTRGVRTSAGEGVVVPTPNFFLSGAGIVCSLASVIWTWGSGARLSKRLLRRPATRIQAANMLRRATRVGISVNCVGLLLTLLAAEEIVGALAIKVLTNRGFVGGGGGASLAAQALALSTMEGLQPLDILIVQANTNTLLSHFCSLLSLLFLTSRIDKLDPPSTEDKPRGGGRR